MTLNKKTKGTAGLPGPYRPPSLIPSNARTESMTVAPSRMFGVRCLIAPHSRGPPSTATHANEKSTPASVLSHGRFYVASIPKRPDEPGIAAIST